MAPGARPQQAAVPDNGAGLLAYLCVAAIERKLADLDITIDDIAVAATRASGMFVDRDPATGIVVAAHQVPYGDHDALCCAHSGVGAFQGACLRWARATRAATGSLCSDLDTADDIAKAIADPAPAITPAKLECASRPWSTRAPR